MSNAPDYTGFDPRKQRGERMTLDDTVTRFHNEKPEGTDSVNLGCGQNPSEGFINIDIVDMPGVDRTADLFGVDWPLEDDSVGLAYMSHFMEHVPNWNQFWGELWRVIADEGRVVIVSPWFRSDRYAQDPTHCQKLLDNKFIYLSRDWRKDNKLDHSYVDVNFVMEFDTYKSWAQHLVGRDKEVQREAELREWNAITDCVWFLKALKTQASYDAYVERVKKEFSAQ